MVEIDFTKHQVVLLQGKGGRGKSNAVRYFLIRNIVDDVFEFGVVFTGSKLNKDFDFLPDEVVIEGFDEDILENYVAFLEEEKSKGKLPINFIVFDDLVNLLKVHDTFLNNFITKVRHYNCRIFICVQHLNQGASTVLKEMTTNALMYKTTSFNTLRSLWENFGQSFESFNEFRSFFLDHTKQPFTALGFDSNEERFYTFKAPLMTDFKEKLTF